MHSVARQKSTSSIFINKQLPIKIIFIAKITSPIELASEPPKTTFLAVETARIDEEERERVHVEDIKQPNKDGNISTQ